MRGYIDQKSIQKVFEEKGYTVLKKHNCATYSTSYRFSNISDNSDAI